MRAHIIDDGGLPAENAQHPSSIRVWDLPTRVFHWGLATSFAGAYLSGEFEQQGELHAVFGYAMLLLIGFRLVWGLVGSRYARFSSFVRGPSAILRYLGSMFSRQPEHHVGHNPAGAVAIVLLLGLGALVAAAGLATLNGLGGEWFEEIHEAVAQLMLAVVGVHLAGVVVGSLVHRENLVRAMITGRKQGDPQDAIGGGHRLLGVVLLAGLLALGAVWATGSARALPGLGEVDALAQEWQEEHAERGERDD
jgi:cytochrome b